MNQVAFALAGVQALALATLEGPRFLVLHLPAFRLERCGWHADERVALIAEEKNALRIQALTPAAWDAGLRRGMMAAEARALVSDVEMELLDEVGEKADRDALIRDLEMLADRVVAYSPREILLEISPVAHLHHGELGVIARVRARAEELGHLCCIAVADHPLAAAALASNSEEDVLVPRGEGAAWLGALSIQALRPSKQLFASMTALGVRTVEAWARLDPASVAGRFGEEGVTLHRVARGKADHAWVAAPNAQVQERIVLPVDDVIISVDEVMRVLDPGLHTLRERLVPREEAVSALEVRLALERGPASRFQIRVGHPTRDPVVLHRLVRDRLERLMLDAPVMGVSIVVREVAPGLGWQEELTGRREASEPLPELLARLCDVLGEHAVFFARPVDAWRPESCWRPRAVNEAAIDPTIDDSADPAAAHEQLTWNEVRPRPTLLRHPPLPIRIRERNEWPVSIRSERGWVPILKVGPPEILEGEWWHPDGGFSRRYHVAELPEGEVWLFYERSQWFLHGWFD